MEEPAFYKMFEKIADHLKREHDRGDKWVSDEEAMRLLRITSKTTLQKLRDTDQIRFSQPAKKHIVYDTDSIKKYLDKHANI